MDDAELRAAFARIEKRFDDLDRKIDHLTVDVRSVQADTAMLKGSVDEVSGRMGRLERVVSGVARKLLAPDELVELGIKPAPYRSSGLSPGDGPAVAMAAKPEK